MKSNWNDWLTYFLNGIAIQAQDVLSRAERINNHIINWQITAGGSSPVLQEIVTLLAVNPFITAKKISQNFNIAFTAAQRAIKKLESLNIIENITRTKRDRMYCATEILNILEEPTKIHQHNNEK